MPDKFDKETRSKIMSKIRSNKTGPELALKSAIRGMGFNYQPKHPCKPDFIHRKNKIAIYVDGDFWHGYNWKKLGKIPPRGYWQEKIKKNIERDKKCTKQLKREGFKVLRFWEHEINRNINHCVSKVFSKV